MACRDFVGKRLFLFRVWKEKAERIPRLVVSLDKKKLLFFTNLACIANAMWSRVASDHGLPMN